MAMRILLAVTFQIQWRVFGHFIWWDGVVML
jgi:hypothetical protein